MTEEGGNGTCVACQLHEGDAEPVLTSCCRQPIHLRCLLTWSQRRLRAHQPTTCPSCRCTLLERSAEDYDGGEALHIHVVTEGRPGPGDREAREALSDASESEMATDDLPVLLDAVRRGALEDLRGALGRVPRRTLNERESDGCTALHHAVALDDSDAVQLLLEAGASPRVANAYGQTPLHVAAENRNVSVGRLLLNKRSCPDVHDGRGETPLHLATRRGSAEFVQMLTRRGVLVDAQCVAGRTPMHLAARRPNVPVTRALLRAGAALDIVDREGDTPVHVAAARGNVSFIKAVLPTCPRYVVRSRNMRRSRPEDLARVARSDEAAALLREAAERSAEDHGRLRVVVVGDGA